MNCSTFRNKVNDLLEESISKDLKESMEQHMCECASCKSYYEEEKGIDLDFSGFFSMDGLEFKSSRAEIMKQINKNRYKNNYLIKFYNHFNQYKKQYAVWAAVLIFIVFAGPYAARGMHDKLEKSTGSTSSNSASESSLQINGGTSSQDVPNVDVSKENIQSQAYANNDIQFLKEKVENEGSKLSFGTWKVSENGEKSACIENSAGNDNFGIRRIYLKENNELFSFTIDQQPTEGNTPMYLEWWQSNMLMIIVGYGYGTESQGGSIYMLNTDTGIADLVYRPSEAEQIKSFTIKDGDITGEVIVFEDDNHTKSHIETINIPLEDVKNMMSSLHSLPKEASIIYEFQEDINNKRQAAALNLIYNKEVASKKFDYNKLIYEVENMSITTLTTYSSNYNKNDITQGCYENKAYYAVIVYKNRDANTGKTITSTVNKLFILVKAQKDSTWEIGEIIDIP